MIHTFFWNYFGMWMLLCEYNEPNKNNWPQYNNNSNNNNKDDDNTHKNLSRFNEITFYQKIFFACKPIKHSDDQRAQNHLTFLNFSSILFVSSFGVFRIKFSMESTRSQSHTLTYICSSTVVHIFGWTKMTFESVSITHRRDCSRRSQPISSPI